MCNFHYLRTGRLNMFSKLVPLIYCKFVLFLSFLQTLLTNYRCQHCANYFWSQVDKYQEFNTFPPEWAKLSEALGIFSEMILNLKQHLFLLFAWFFFRPSLYKFRTQFNYKYNNCTCERSCNILLLKVCGPQYLKSITI